MEQTPYCCTDTNNLSMKAVRQDACVPIATYWIESNVMILSKHFNIKSNFMDETHPIKCTHPPNVSSNWLHALYHIKRH